MGHGCRTTPREALTNPLAPAPSLPPPPPPVCFALPHYVPDLTDEPKQFRLRHRLQKRHLLSVFFFLFPQGRKAHCWAGVSAVRLESPDPRQARPAIFLPYS